MLVMREKLTFQCFLCCPSGMKHMSHGDQYLGTCISKWRKMSQKLLYYNMCTLFGYPHFGVNLRGLQMQ